MGTTAFSVVVAFGATEEVVAAWGAMGLLVAGAGGAGGL